MKYRQKDQKAGAVVPCDYHPNESHWPASPVRLSHRLQGGATDAVQRG